MDLDHTSLFTPAAISVSVGAFAVCFLTMSIRPFTGSAFIKWLALAPIALWAYVNAVTNSQTIFAGALFMHTIGDALLELGKNATRRTLFFAALLSFMGGHLLYFAVFVFDAIPHMPDLMSQLPRLAALLMLCLCCVSTGFIAKIWRPYPKDAVLDRPGVGMRLAMSSYCVAILLMSVAGLISDVHKRRRVSLQSVGVLLYVISDCCIGYGLTHKPSEKESGAQQLFTKVLDTLTWPTYYLGQVLVTMTFMLQEMPFLM